MKKSDNEILSNVRFMAETEVFNDSKKFYLRGYIGGKAYAAKPIVFEELPEGFVMEPFLVSQGLINENEFPPELLAIFNSMWESGARPKNYKDHRLEVVALKNHLEDMRILALKDKHKALTS